jgi:hypothetical protein
MNDKESESRKTTDVEIMTAVLLAAGKANSKHPHSSCFEYLIAIGRRRVETAFSDIAKYMPKKIHSVTDTVFLIKLIAFI